MDFHRRNRTPFLTVALASLPVSALLVLLAPSGCTVSVGDGNFDGGFFSDSGTNGGDGGSPLADGAINDGSTPPPDAAPNGTDSCSVCLFNQCAGVKSACFANADCLGIYNCTTQAACATSATCVDQCYKDRPGGQAAYLALAKCDQSSACTTCTAACTNNPIRTNCQAYSSDGGVDVCRACMNDKCNAFQDVCGENSPCQKYTQCSASCVQGPTAQLDACLNGCNSLYENGGSQARNLATCMKSSCEKECLPGPK